MCFGKCSTVGCDNSADFMLGDEIFCDLCYCGQVEPDCMDGDFDSGMASAGFGTDEDYNHYDYPDYEGDFYGE